MNGKVALLLRKSISSFGKPADVSTDSLGCSLNKLSRNQVLHGAGLAVLRKGSHEGLSQQVSTEASNRGFVIGVSTLPGHTRRIFHEHHATSHVFEQESVYIRSLGEAYKADLQNSFDFVLFEVAPTVLETIAEEADLRTVSALNTITGQPDPVLANLARALMPALENPNQASRLFVDQLTGAIGTHVVQQYGNRTVSSQTRTRKLSRVQENVAKAIILDNLDGNLSISDLAQACNLSRGYFIHAFRETTGMTPYQWLLRERIAKARMLLVQTDATIFDIAISCGFSDQSHFTRVFSNVVGTTPGNWRRNA
ncbi:AraC-like DNA-binding protein [Agrobacterium vitis]|nr:AraC-like DNA-binding protein [Agrobacterium vitis]MBE1436278.1 AraC-like DNA-binding protein [Agrobacterium vitis]